jgi:glycogen debranching enzyme
MPTEPDPAAAPRQPFLHDRVAAVAAPTVVLSGTDGDLDASGHPADGILSSDVRVLSVARLEVDGRRPVPVSWAAEDASRTTFVGILRHVGDPGPDPTVWVRRRRVARAHGADEHITIHNASAAALDLDVVVHLASDMAAIEEVKSGRFGRPAAWHVDGATLRASGEGLEVRVRAPGASAVTTPAEPAARIGWQLGVPSRADVTVRWSVDVDDPGGAVAAAAGDVPWGVPVVRADDVRLAPWVARSLDDLRVLRMTLPEHPADQFLAAGVPWYLTLFGRDSLWAARMMLPLGTGLAAGTLRTLAGLQGGATVAATAEEPGKILHELRRSDMAFGTTSLPPAYYGTIDATPLWVCLLVDAWRWGMPEDEVAAVLPALERALVWIRDHGDQDGDGFLEYIDRTGHGLANQGWKDSGDSVRFADGSIAEGPVALAEAQGYAFEAAVGGAALLDAFDRPGGAEWRGYGAALAERFRARFWVHDSHGPYPAMALDGSKRPVDAVASNMGHLLGTGMLDATEEAAVAARLTDAAMASGFGMRTMASTAGGYSPLSYHCGSVWPHDTAIAVLGLSRAGFGAEAAMLARQLADAAAAFDDRLPELFGGFAAGDTKVPVPYPASCRPQAWSAAAAIAVLQATLGLVPDAPGGTVRVRPHPTFGALAVEGVQLGNRSISLGVDAAGTVTEATLPPGIRLVG